MTTVIAGGAGIWMFRHYNIDMGSLLENLKRFPKQILGIGLLLALLQVFFQGMRWAFLFPSQWKIPKSSVLASYCFGQAVNLVIPARIGEVVKIGTLAKRELSASQKTGKPQDQQAPVVLQASAALALDKVVDGGALIVLLLIAGVDFLSQKRFQPDWNHFSELLPWAVGVIAAIFFLRWFFLKKRPELWRRCQDWIRRILFLMKELLTFRMLSLSFVAGVLQWCTEAYILYLLAQALGFHLGFTQLMWGLAALGVGGSVPLTFGNFGAFEATLGFALNQVDIPLAPALAIATVHHLLQLGGIFVWSAFQLIRLRKIF